MDIFPEGKGRVRGGEAQTGGVPSNSPVPSVLYPNTANI